jgi:hypothetical protein
MSGKTRKVRVHSPYIIGTFLGILFVGSVGKAQAACFLTCSECIYVCMYEAGWSVQCLAYSFFLFGRKGQSVMKLSVVSTLHLHKMTER